MTDTTPSIQRVLHHLLLASGAIVLLPGIVHSAQTTQDFSSMSLDELSEIKISSVSRRLESLQDAPAAIYVIRREDIRRSGATSLPEVLRLAPNLQVARIDASRYAISARGFNNASANKLLVLIDGRIVYSPLHSGVFWEAQDVFLADVERIEVISGPGGSLWGSNAVNGVINILTRKTSEALGTLASAAAGSDERSLHFRHGAAWGENGHFRIYAQAVQRDDTETSTGASAQDAFRKSQAGFRSNWRGSRDIWLVQGDLYDGSIDQPSLPDRLIKGANLSARWNRSLDDGASIQGQAYYDQTKQVSPSLFDEVLHTYNVEIQHQFNHASGHSVVWGAGYRMSNGTVNTNPSLAILPAQRRLHWANIFAQDTVPLSQQLQLAFGVKLEHNSYTGLETQPNIRLSWKPNEAALMWSAVSRVVRTPSRLDRDFYAPSSPPYLLAGGPNFTSERLTAYELGYRQQVTPQTSYSISTFYNDYSQLRSLESAPGAGGTYVLGNEMQGHTTGVELWGVHRLTEQWRVTAGYNLLNTHLGFAPGSGDTNVSNAGNDPRHQFSIRMAANLASNVEFDVGLRSIGRLPNPAVPSYTEMDLRLGWIASKHFELSLSANNLLHRRHTEFAASASAPPLQIGRSYLLRMLWNL